MLSTSSRHAGAAPMRVCVGAVTNRLDAVVAALPVRRDGGMPVDQASAPRAMKCGLRKSGLP